MLKLQPLYQCNWQEPHTEIVQQSYRVALGYDSMMKWLVVPVASFRQQKDVGYEGQDFAWEDKDLTWDLT
jgi:hypothetical protein